MWHPMWTIAMNNKTCKLLNEFHSKVTLSISTGYVTCEKLLNDARSKVSLGAATS